jgi:hypothetical protein
MGYFDNIRFEAEDGIYFNATIQDRTQLMFLDISLLEDLARKKIVNGRPVALTFFHGLQSIIFRMVIKALKENPSWDPERPLPLLRSYLY